MVGHTGNYTAAVKAVEFLDQCISKIVKVCEQKNITALVTADHGNADQMAYPDGSPHTSHSEAPAPFCIIDKSLRGKKINPAFPNPSLKDVAPTILSIMSIPSPAWFTGKPIFEIYKI